MRTLCAALPALAVAACGSSGRDHLVRLDDRHTLAAPVTVGNLTVWPVLTDRPLDVGEFLALDEALEKGVAEVREVGAAAAGQVREAGPEAAETLPNLEEELPAGLQPTQQEAQTAQIAQTAEGGAVVNTLVIENKGDLPILVCAGTVVKGGNQDRQIGQDFVLEAKSTTPVDAFCVEQGRWQSLRLGEETSGKFQVLDGMATAKVRAKGQYEKDQGGVWQEVRTVRTYFSTSVRAQAAEGEGAFEEPAATFAFPFAAEDALSSSLAVALDATAASAADLKRCEAAVQKHFAAHEGAVGFAYAINGKPVAVRTFAHPRLLRKQLQDFVRGMAADALVAKGEPARDARAEDVVALVKEISTAHERVEATSGLNRNGIRVAEAGFNSNCYVPAPDGEPFALTQDWTAK
jgi:hypothetical protein